MYDREAFDSIAAAIIEWQAAAQQLPLADLTEVMITCQNGLAESLNAFNESYLDDECGESAAAMTEAIGAVARRATAAAIFTLGISQRVHLAAHQN